VISAPLNKWGGVGWEVPLSARRQTSAAAPERPSDLQGENAGKSLGAASTRTEGRNRLRSGKLIIKITVSGKKEPKKQDHC